MDAICDESCQKVVLDHSNELLVHTQSLRSPLISTYHILGHGCNMWWFMSKDCFKSFQWTCLHTFWAFFWQLDHTSRGKWCWTHDWNFKSFISTSLFQQLFLAYMNQPTNSSICSCQVNQTYYISIMMLKPWKNLFKLTIVV